MKQTNFHCHTSRCHHAYGKDEDFVTTAIQNGFEILGFSDHTCWNYTSDFISRIRMTCSEFANYKDSITYLKRKYAKQIEIRLGMEAEYFPDYMDWLLNFCAENEIEYLILGNHYYQTDEKGIYYGGAKDKYVQAYFDSCVAGMKTGMYAYLAHPELILRNTHGMLTKEIEKGFHLICRTAKELDMPLEYNVLGMQLNEQMGYEEYPCDAFWKIASQYHLKAIIGMDAHCVGDLNQKWYKKALQNLQKYSVDIIDDIPRIDYKSLKEKKC